MSYRCLVLEAWGRVSAVWRIWIGIYLARCAVLKLFDMCTFVQEFDAEFFAQLQSGRFVETVAFSQILHPSAQVRLPILASNDCSARSPQLLVGVKRGVQAELMVPGHHELVRCFDAAELADEVAKCNPRAFLSRVTKADGHIEGFVCVGQVVFVCIRDDEDFGRLVACWRRRVRDLVV